MAFDNSCTKAVLSASPGPTPKRCEPQLFLAALGQVIGCSICSKAVDLGSLNMQFQHDWPKNKKSTALLLFWAQNLEKYPSTELYDAPLEGSTIFLYRSTTSGSPLDSSELDELKYEFFSRTGRNTKKLRRGNRCEKFGPVLIPALRRSYQNRCEVLFFLEGESHASQNWPTLRQSYTISPLSKSP